MLWVGLVLALAPPVEATDTLWEAVPLVTQANLNAGNSGGEGCQVIQNLAVDSTGNFLIMGTDVGGLYRSLDGGATWQPANVGFSPRGGAAFAIDPNNNNRVLAVGCDSAAHSWNGLWLSPSQGANWYRVRPLNLRGSGTYHDSVAFDPSSASVSAGVTFSSVAYWVADSDGGGGLWKSTDGGRNWSEVQTTLSDGIVKVNPASGAVYVATRNGFYRSTNGGAGFTQVLSGSVLGLDVISSRPNYVYINLGDGAYLSTDSGLSFAKLGNQGLPTSYSPGLRNLKVSPVNPQNMLINDDLGIYDHQMHFYSNDGGNTWAECSTDFSQSFTPAQEREWLFAWSPKNGQQAWTCGGSFISRTTDGGADFSWANNGFNGYTCTGIFNFNPWSPDLFLVTSQDSNSALTRNITGRPAVWQYLGVSGHGFGFNYGGYALSPLVLAAGNAASWSAPATLMLSTDGGAGWVSEGLVGDNTQASCGDPTDASAAFWDDYRTSDGGKTWFLMPACDGVFTYNSNPNGGHELYGAQGSQVVKSTDHGATWTPVVTVPDTVQDIACDWQNYRLYIVAGKSLYLYSLYGKSPPFSISYRLGLDNAGLQKVLSVAVDPVDPEIVYAGWAGSDYISNQSVRRSLDAGKTWETLTKQSGDRGLDGGRQSICVRVHPVTRYLYSTGSCFGIWRYPPPPPTATPTAGSTSSPQATASNTPAANSTQAATASPTATPSPTPSATPTASPTSTATGSFTPTATNTSTSSPTSTPSPTSSATATASPTSTATGSFTPTATNTPPHSPTSSPPPPATVSTAPTPPTRTVPLKRTMTPTASTTPTASMTATPSLTAGSTLSPTLTATATPSSTSIGTPTFTPTNVAASIFVQSGMKNDSTGVSAIPTWTWTATFTVSPTSTAMGLFTPAATPTSTATLAPVAVFSPAWAPVPVPYPNPVTQGVSSVWVRLPALTGGSGAKLVVLTVAFRKVLEMEVGKVSGGAMAVALPLRDAQGMPLANGLYYLVVETSSGRAVGRMLILR